MAFEHPGAGALDYFPCRYAGSKMLFRGPQKALDKPYLAFFGGTETYGRFIETPYPDLVGTALRRTAVNLGCVNAGVDVFSHEPALLELAGGADASIVQVVGAQNLTNRFYSVHPRRNDRFIGPTPLLKSMFPEVDFADIAFTRHLMTALQRHSPGKFQEVVEELQAVWVSRTCAFLDALSGPKVVLWLADHTPDKARIDTSNCRSDPLYVNRPMIEAVRTHADEVVELVFDPARATGMDGMVYSSLEAHAALQTPPLDVHIDAAKAVSRALFRHLH